MSSFNTNTQEIIADMAHPFSVEKDISKQFENLITIKVLIKLLYAKDQLKSRKSTKINQPKKLKLEARYQLLIAELRIKRHSEMIGETSEEKERHRSLAHKEV